MNVGVFGSSRRELEALRAATDYQRFEGEAARLIKGGGISINGQRVVDEKSRVLPTDAMHARYFVVRKGKRDNFLVRVDRDVTAS